MVIIWTNLVVFSHLILHAKFHGNQPSSTGEKDLDLYRLIPYMDWMRQPSCHVTWTIQIEFFPPTPPPPPPKNNPSDPGPRPLNDLDL